MIEMVLSVLLGVGLAAACGFRVFIPPTIGSLAAMSGHLTLAPGFEWIGTWPALAVLVVAALVEVAGYYLPFVDHFLDLIAAPVAIVAGAVLTAAFVGGMDPMLKWTLAGIVGGGAALAVKAGTATVRAASTATTAGLGNFVVATLEVFAAGATAILAVVAPFLAVAGLAAAIVASAWVVVRFRRSRARGNPPAPAAVHQ